MMSDQVNDDDEVAQFDVDPWPPAQEALFNVVRIWVREEDTQVAAEKCLQVMKDINETPGAPFIFVAELARVLAETVARYMAAINEVMPTRDDVLAELDILECEYIEESVLAEMDNEDDPPTPS